MKWHELGVHWIPNVVLELVYIIICGSSNNKVCGFSLKAKRLQT